MGKSEDIVLKNYYGQSERHLLREYAVWVGVLTNYIQAVLSPHIQYDLVCPIISGGHFLHLCYELLFPGGISRRMVRTPPGTFPLTDFTAREPDYDDDKFVSVPVKKGN